MQFTRVQWCWIGNTNTDSFVLVRFSRIRSRSPSMWSFQKLPMLLPEDDTGDEARWRLSRQNWCSIDGIIVSNELQYLEQVSCLGYFTYPPTLGTFHSMLVYLHLLRVKKCFWCSSYYHHTSIPRNATADNWTELFSGTACCEQQRKNAVGWWLNLPYSSLIGAMIAAQWLMDIFWFLGIVFTSTLSEKWFVFVENRSEFFFAHANGFPKRWVVNGDLEEDDILCA